MPLTPADPPLAPKSPPARKTVFAAGLLLAMFLFSGSLAVYSAWLLWRGEDAEAVLTGLPDACVRVVLVDKPGASGAVAAAVARHGVQWTGGGDANALLRGLSQYAPPREIDPNQAFALCYRGEKWFGAAVPATGFAAEAAARAFAQWIGAALGQNRGAPSGGARMKGQWGRWVGMTDDRVLWIARDAGPVVQALWSASAATPTDSIEQAETAMNELLAAVQARTLQKDESFRAALERTGGGDVHTFERGPPLKAALDNAQGWSEAANVLDWRGAALRIERGQLIVHEHLGGGQRFATWLKRHFDMPAEFDAARVLPADGVTRWGVDRYSHLAALDADLTCASLPARRAAMPSSTVATDRAWDSALAGPVAWFIGSDGCPVFAAAARTGAPASLATLPDAVIAPPCGQSMRKWAGGYLLVGPPDGVAQVERVLNGKARSLADTDLDRDVRRMTGSTNGWRSATPAGLRVLEWTWVDTGVVVERTFAGG